ncbi:MAG: deoxynucleoside kinase [Leptolinea sp.]|jgi:deoxyadenosine/deoxycytidine kinase|nr:deoxynucleoside kinase [Leptolinea sp.]
MNKFIIVAGNIGVGKSTLVSLLCQKLGWEPFYEPETENPYLSDFYQDMSRWSFQSQVFFLSRRMHIHHQILHYSGSVIQDRSIYEDAEVFARNLYLQGNMSDRDYVTYRSLYQTMTEFLPPPDLVIYLRASVETLQKRIALRNRDYERSISTEYLDRVNRLYTDWLTSFTLCPVLTIPADELDYVVRPDHLELIVGKVQQKLTGKDEVIFSGPEIRE